MKIDRLLPLGSVVYLSEGIIPIMIGIRQPIIQLDSDQCYFDYAGFSQVTGINANEIAYFNNEDIRELVAEGYIGEEEKRIQMALSEWRDKNTVIPKGRVIDNLNNKSSIDYSNGNDVNTFGF